MRNIFCIALLASAPVLAQGVPPVVGTDKWHTVQAGENMHKIARKYEVAIEHLAWANKLPIALAVEPGTKLRVPLRRILPGNPPKNGLVVNLPERSAYFFREGKYVDFYPVGIGMEEPAKFRTPVGLFKVTETVKNPDWHAPKWAKSKVKVVKSGTDKNPLGDRWIGISADGIGFHGTKDPVGVGDAKSHGCFRMATDDIHELFDKVRAGDVVRIDYQPFRLGIDKKTGEHVVAAFPDVYKKGSVEQKAAEVLGQGGVRPNLVDDAALKRVVKNATGVPVAIAGQDVGNKADGEQLNGGVAADKDVPTVAAEAAEPAEHGAAELAAATPAAALADTSSPELQVNEAAAVLPGSKVLVSARPLLDAMDIAYTYDPTEGTVTIDSDAE
jgi:L,D-transpeptidase ErfK/SrfK